MEFKIPFEKRRLTGVELAIAMRDGNQIPYTSSLSKSGDYRTWISAMTEDQLEKFIARNEEILSHRLANLPESVDPNWERHRVFAFRNCLYMTEIYLRHNTDTQRLDDDLLSYYTNWAGKFERAKQNWLASLKPAEQRPAEKSEVNPYY